MNLPYLTLKSSYTAQNQHFGVDYFGGCFMELQFLKDNYISSLKPFGTYGSLSSITPYCND